MTFPHGDRVLRGQVHWCKPPDDFTNEMSALEVEDRFAWNAMQGLIHEAASVDGVELRHHDVRCPLPFAPPDAEDPPWLGEFKVPGQHGKHWRLYFGEAINHQDHVVRIKLWSKLERWSPRQTKKYQRKSIVDAMKRLKWFFKLEGYEWSQFPNQ